MNQDLDVIIIGWGKGGKTLAGTLARNGQRVAMVEASADMFGGTCINIGCVPTKALIHDAQIRDSVGFDPQYFEHSVKRRDQLTAMMRQKNYAMLNELDAVALFTGRASFIGPDTIRVSTDTEQIELRAAKIVINTGSLPTVPAITGAQVGGRIHDSTTLQHADLPHHLVVVGGGYVGIEFASMFAHYGSRVTILDRGTRPLKKEDPDVAAEVVSALADAGVEILSAATVTELSAESDRVMVHYQIAGEHFQLNADAVLLALGRTPNTVGLNLAAAGVEVGERGEIVVDEYLRTSVEGIYALGDVNGGPQFTYISLDDYRILADQFLGDGTRRTTDRVAVPNTIFTTPPLARVGLSEEQAREQEYRIKVAVKPVSEIAAMPRPKIVGETRGIVKFVVDAVDDQILGAALMHIDSQEVINLVALAMRQSVTASELRDQIFTHPSSTEALNEVLGLLD